MNDISISRPVHPLGFKTKDLPFRQLAALVDALETVGAVLGGLREQPRFSGVNLITAPYNEAGVMLEDLHDQINGEIDDIRREVEKRPAITTDEAQSKFGVLIGEFTGGCDDPAFALAQLAKIVADMGCQPRKGGDA